MGNEPARGCPDPPHGVTYGWSSVCLGVGDSVVLSLASGSLPDLLAGSAPGVGLSASAGLRMASSGPTATPRTRTAMTMITRISTGSSSTVAQLLRTVCCTSSSTRSWGIAASVDLPLSHRTEPATQEPDQPHDPPPGRHTVLHLRAGTVVRPSAATQCRVGRHDAGQDIDGLDADLAFRDRRVGCPTVKAKLHTTCPFREEAGGSGPRRHDGPP